MTESIRDQIEFLKISGSVLPPGSAEKMADTMEKLLAVYEAARWFSMHIPKEHIGGLMQRTKYEQMLEAIDAVQTKPEPKSKSQERRFAHQTPAPKRQATPYDQDDETKGLADAGRENK